MGALAALAACPSPAQAESGFLDPSFGDGGRAFTDFGGADEGVAVAVDGQGRVLSAGTGGISDPARAGEQVFSIARYLHDGTLDPSFGDDGRVQTDFGGSSQRIAAVSTYPGGRIVAAGTSLRYDYGGPTAVAKGRMAIARYLPDGTPDPGFGKDGRVTTKIGTLAVVHDAAVDSAGRIVTLGFSPNVEGSVVSRYLPDGTLDPGFAGDGTRAVFVGHSSGFVKLAVDAADRIHLVGSRSRARGGHRLLVVRLLGDGRKDPGFGDGGVVRVLPPTYADPADLAISPDGTLVVAATCRCRRGKRSRVLFVVTRLHRDGSVDRDFASSGHRRFAFGRRPSRAASLTIDSVGRIIVGGKTAFRAWALARLAPSGRLDDSFSEDGKTTSRRGDRGLGLSAVAVDENDAVLAVGSTPFDFETRRYLP